MSDIKWCDVGGHAFSTNDPDRKSYVEGDTYDGGLKQRIDICGPCVRKGDGLRTLSITDTAAKPTVGNYDREGYLGHE